MRTRGWRVKSRTQGTYLYKPNVFTQWWCDDKKDARVFLTKFEAFCARDAFYATYPDGVAGVHVVRVTSRRKK